MRSSCPVPSSSCAEVSFPHGQAVTASTATHKKKSPTHQEDSTSHLTGIRFLSPPARTPAGALLLHTQGPGQSWTRCCISAGPTLPDGWRHHVVPGVLSRGSKHRRIRLDPDHPPVRNEASETDGELTAATARADDLVGRLRRTPLNERVVDGAVMRRLGRISLPLPPPRARRDLLAHPDHPALEPPGGSLHRGRTALRNLRPTPSLDSRSASIPVHTSQHPTQRSPSSIYTWLSRRVVLVASRG